VQIPRLALAGGGKNKLFIRCVLLQTRERPGFFLDDMALRKLPFMRLVTLAVASLLSLMLNFAVTAQRTRQNTARSAAPAASPGTAAFRAKVESILAAPETNRGYWGMLIEDADSGEVIFSLNADHYFLPASNAKLFTTALAMATLGADYRFHTTVESRAPVDADGTIQGDLVLVGRGDPDLSNRVFPFAKKTERDGPPEKILLELADAVIARGVKKITGDVIGDDSYFTGGTYPSGWSIDDMLWNYGAPVSALEINDGTLFIELQPGASVGAPATYTAAPWAGIYQIRNSVVTSARGTAQMLTVQRDPGSSEIILSGSMPLSAAPHSLGVAIDRPAEYAAAMLKILLEARGVQVYGHARARHFGDPGAESNSVPAACCTMMGNSMSNAAGNAVESAAPSSTNVVLAEHLSLQLSDALTVMDKISQNLHAEMLWRVAAREKTGDPSEAIALQFEEDFRKTMGLADDDAVMSDASGLSRRDLVTPQSEVSVLRWAAEQPWGGAYRSFLPVAGEDGTLMDRMVNTPAAGHIWAKTGSLTHVDSLAGYATTTRGAHLVFSFMGNNHNLKGPAATAVLDALAVAMVQNLGPSHPQAHK
jgi:serine-type D-Ala-D-Ala carboxypeptidase/endopeptidase (penicillin-binding protein 4)